MRRISPWLARLRKRTSSVSEGVASDMGTEVALLRIGAVHADLGEQGGAGFVGEAGEFPFRRGDLLPGGQFGQVLAGG